MSLFSKDRPRVWNIFLIAAVMTVFALPVFAQQVDTAWVRRYNGPGNGNDSAVAIAVDSSGNVYVTGSSFDSTTGYDFCTIKYLPNGDTAWVRRYNGGVNDTDLARALVLDESANVYVTGVTRGTILTLKYDSNGNLLWADTLHSTFNFYQVSVNGGYALGLDGQGHLYVTGQQWDLESWAWYLIKYDTTGNLLWFREVDLTLKTQFDMALDVGGYIYVAAGDELAKYDPQGNRLWLKIFPSGGPIRAIALDENANIYATGPGTSTVKYDSTGNLLWMRVRNFGYNGPSRGGFALAVDKDANVIVFGDAWDIEAAINFLVKYDSLGNELWFFYGTFSDYTYPRKVLVVDAAGNVYLTFVGGFSTIKLDTGGTEIWSKYFYVSGFGNPLSAAVTPDSKGNVYLTGSVQIAGSGIDYLTIKYAPLPKLKGDLNLDGTLSSADVVLGVNCTFLGQAPPAAPIATDLNCDGKVTPADVVILLYMVFLSAPAPC